jgi:para-nitrobenzyl esterase
MLIKVKTENGLVEGLPAADPRITSFKGVPYGAPATGANRWRPPQPAQNWEGVFQAYKFRPISMQHIPGEDPDNIYSREWNVNPAIAMDEDSLYLNIWTPARSADEKLPVFVWYFGGGLQEGNTAEMEFDGERLARRGLVVVTINYRLNAFGFLCHPEITAENPEAPANFGNLDQQFGTRWVQRNIAAFGGNPKNITIGGQSAGGMSVMSQVTSPQNDGLFQRAIVDSGIMKMPYASSLFGGDRDISPRTLPQAEQDGVKFFEFLGVKTLAEARKLDAFYIRDKVVEYKRFWPSVIDGKFCVGDTTSLYLENKCQKVPMLFGHTATEMLMKPEAKTAAEFEAFARKTFGDAADEFLTLCDSTIGSVTEMRYKAQVAGTELALRKIAEAKAATGDKNPIYYWVFDPSMPGWDNPGSFHSSDLWFWFETLAKCWRPFTGKHYDLSRQMCNYWANFARSGDPNGLDADGSEMTAWKPFTADSPNRIFLEDKIYASDKGPSPLMKFLMKNVK